MLPMACRQKPEFVRDRKPVSDHVFAFFCYKLGVGRTMAKWNDTLRVQHQYLWFTWRLFVWRSVVGLQKNRGRTGDEHCNIWNASEHNGGHWSEGAFSPPDWRRMRRRSQKKEQDCDQLQMWEDIGKDKKPFTRIALCGSVLSVNSWSHGEVWEWGSLTWLQNIGDPVMSGKFEQTLITQAKKLLSFYGGKKHQKKWCTLLCLVDCGSLALCFLELIQSDCLLFRLTLNVRLIIANEKMWLMPSFAVLFL